MIFRRPAWQWFLAWIVTFALIFAFSGVPAIASIFGLVNFLISIPLFFYLLWKMFSVMLPFGIAAWFDGGSSRRY